MIDVAFVACAQEAIRTYNEWMMDGLDNNNNNNVDPITLTTMEEHIASTCTTPPSGLAVSNIESNSSQDDKLKDIKLNITVPDASTSPPNVVVAELSSRERLRQLEPTFRPPTVAQSSMKKSKVEQAANVTAETNNHDDNDDVEALNNHAPISDALLSSSPTDNIETRSVEMNEGNVDEEIRQQGVLPEQEDPATQAPIIVPVVLRMPNTGFGLSMGLAGNSIMWKMAGSASFLQERFDSDLMNQILWFAALIVGIMILLTYIYKAIFRFHMVVLEYKDPVRVHFMNTPHLILLMLALGIPRKVDASETALQIVFAVGLFAQTGLTQFIYEKWMFSQDSNITIGQPPFLLSVVGWFLLSVLGQQANIDDSWGIALPSFCFGVGALFYVMVLISVFNRLHENRNKKGSPALTLLIAPPAIAVLAIDGFDGNPTQFSVVAEMWLGWCLMVLLLILKTGPRIAENPKSFGAYWAYVFPLSALATSCIRYAIIRDSTTADIMAVVFMGVAIVALLVVLTRMVVHMILCFQEKERWEDPLLGIYSKEK